MMRDLRMSSFEIPADLGFNRGRVEDPLALAQEFDAKSWLCLTGEEFAQMEGGMSFAQVEDAVEHAANIVSDPPVELTVDLVRQHVVALDELPRPTLVTCRMGPRASVSVYVYAGLKAGATPDEVLARADADGAPFAETEQYRDIVRRSLEELA